MITATFAYPPGTLSGNSRCHWRVRSAAVKRFRSECGKILLASSTPIARHQLKSYKKLAVHYTFCPGNNRKRDLDGAVYQFKAGQDGIQDALDIDDSQFVCTYEFGPVVKGGAVTVTIKGAV